MRPVWALAKYSCYLEPVRPPEKKSLTLPVCGGTISNSAGEVA